MIWRIIYLALRKETISWLLQVMDKLWNDPMSQESKANTFWGGRRGGGGCFFGPNMLKKYNLQVFNPTFWGQTRSLWILPWPQGNCIFNWSSDYLSILLHIAWRCKGSQLFQSLWLVFVTLLFKWTISTQSFIFYFHKCFKTWNLLEATIKNLRESKDRYGPIPYFPSYISIMCHLWSWVSKNKVPGFLLCSQLGILNCLSSQENLYPNLLGGHL